MAEVRTLKPRPALAPARNPVHLRRAASIFTLLIAVLAAPAPAPAQGGATTPTDLILVLDNSGSMKKNDPDFLAREAVNEFIGKLAGDYQVGLIIFDQRVDYAVPLTPLNEESRALLLGSLDRINYRGQLTDSPSAVERAIYALKTEGRDGVEKAVVFMTDGIVDTGNPDVDVDKARWLREDLTADAAAADIGIFAIAFTENADFFLIQQLARRTGGEYYRALAAADLKPVFGEIVEALDAPPEVQAPEPVAEPAPPPASQAPQVDLAARGTEDDDNTEIPLTEDEIRQLQEAGLTAEEIAQLQPGGAIVIPPPAPAAPAEGGSLLILAAGALVLLALVAAVVLFIRRRAASSPEAGAPAGGGDAEEVPAAYLIDINDITDERTFQLGDKPVMVGRVAGSDTQHLDYFVVPKNTVGRRHAVFKYKDFAYWIVDQGSVNGTYVNGERINGEQQLKHGDRVKFHKYEFEFSVPDLEDSSHTVFAGSPDATMVADVNATMAASAAALTASPEPGSQSKPAAEPPPPEDTLSFVAGDVAEDNGSAAADDDTEFLETSAGQGAPWDSGATDNFDAPASEDFFDATGGGMAAPPDEDDDDGFGDSSEQDPTALSARARSASGDELDDTAEFIADDEFGVSSDMEEIDDDEDFRTVMPDAEAPAPAAGADDFDTEASAFFDDSELSAASGNAPGGEAFEDMTDFPLANDKESRRNPDAAGGSGQDAIDAKLEQATAILEAGDLEASDDDDGAVLSEADTAMIDGADFNELETAVLDGAAADESGGDEGGGEQDFSEFETMVKDGPAPAGGEPGAAHGTNVSLDAFVSTDSFDSPPTAVPEGKAPDSRDVSMDAFVSTSVFDGTPTTRPNEKELPPSSVFDDTGEDRTLMPEEAAKNPPPGAAAGPAAAGEDTDEFDDDDFFDITGSHEDEPPDPDRKS